MLSPSCFGSGRRPLLAFVVRSRGLAAPAIVWLILESRRGVWSVAFGGMFLRSGGEAYLLCHYGGDARHFAVGCSEHCGVVVFWLLLVSVKGAPVVLFRRRAVGCGMQEGGTHLLSGSSVYIGLLDCGRLWPLEDLSVLLHPSDSPTMALLWYPRTWRRRPFRRFRLSGFKVLSHRHW
ncbi:hypothetical protein F2Q70_00025577 [Brassica cretica]|uniref:Uncharacterized protein n=2 Tax=Brassica TaxID=3705 RepID=A0A8S9L8B3_BRACR|nr:hypothetical protein F2Q70_00025577 [Brassica cretica]